MVTKITLKMGGGDVVVTADEYLDMPVQERVDLLLTNKIEFLDENGKEVLMAVAIRELRELKKNR